MVLVLGAEFLVQGNNFLAAIGIVNTLLKVQVCCESVQNSRKFDECSVKWVSFNNNKKIVWDVGTSCSWRRARAPESTPSCGVWSCHDPCSSILPCSQDFGHARTSVQHVSQADISGTWTMPPVMWDPVTVTTRPLAGPKWVSLLCRVYPSCHYS